MTDQLREALKLVEGEGGTSGEWVKEWETIYNAARKWLAVTESAAPTVQWCKVHQERAHKTEFEPGWVCAEGEWNGMAWNCRYVTTVALVPMEDGEAVSDD